MRSGNFTAHFSFKSPRTAPAAPRNVMGLQQVKNKAWKQQVSMQKQAAEHCFMI